MASMVLGTVGTMLLGPVGGFIGAAIGAAIDAYLFTPAPPDVEGPRIEDTRTSSADPGTPIPVVHGADRVGCIVIGCTNLIETKNTEKIKSGKKSYESTTYTYSVTCDLLLSEGPILGIGRIWSDGKLIRGTREDFEIDAHANRYKVGLFPYPDFYRYADRMYDPALLPWSLDPSLHPNPSSQRWVMEGQDLVPTSLEGTHNKGKVVYWQDLNTGCYLPVAATVAYSRENVLYIGHAEDTEGDVIYTGENIIAEEYSHNHYNSSGSVDWEAFQVAFENKVKAAGPLGGTSLRYGMSYLNPEREYNDTVGGTVSTEFTGFPSRATTEDSVVVSYTANEGIVWARSYRYDIYGNLIVGEYSYWTPIHGELIGGDFEGMTGAGFGANIDAGTYNDVGEGAHGPAWETWSDQLYCTGITMSATMSIANGFRTSTSAAYRQSLYDAIDIGKGFLQLRTSIMIDGWDPHTVADGVREATWRFWAAKEAGGKDSLIYEHRPVAPSEELNSTKAAVFVPPGTRYITYELVVDPIVMPRDVLTGSGSIGYKGIYVRGLVDELRMNILDITRDFDHYYNLHAALNDFAPIAVLTFQNPDNVTFYRGTDDQPPDPTMELALEVEQPGYVNRAHIVFDNLQLEDFGNRLPNFTFEVVRYENETVKTAIVNLMGRAGIEEEYYDVTMVPDLGLNGFLPGYTISSRTNYRKAIEVLVDAFNLDVAEIGPRLLFRQKVRSVDHIIDYRDLAARETTAKAAPEDFRTNRRDITELPRTIETVFKDPGREYQTNTMRQQRGQVAVSNHQSTVELPIVAYSYVMKAWAQSKLQDIWRQRVTTQISLPHRYIKVSPSDIITVVSEEVVGVETRGGVEAEIYGSLEIRVTEVRRGKNGLLEITGVISNGARYPHTDASYDEIDIPSDFVSEFEREEPSLSVLVILDIPALDASHTLPGVYYAVSDVNNETWDGTSVMVSNTADSGYELLDRTTYASAIGVVTGGSMATVNPAYIDTSSDIIVTIDSAIATITSVTVEQMVNERANAAVIGDEIVSFTDATYLGEGQYRLNGSWLRGQRGTDDERMSHAMGDRFVLLNPDTVRDVPRGIEELNTVDFYKGVSVGVKESATPYMSMTYTAERLRPFSPVHVIGTRDESNNLTITWNRRDRLFSAWMDGTDLPMSEATLAYQVDIMSGGTVLRTIDCTTEEAVYSAADQSADGLTPGGPVTVNVYQMSAVVGRGHGAEGTV